MSTNKKTTIFRHRRENLKKCSLRGLESHPSLLFVTYPKITSYFIEESILLTPEAPPLSYADREHPLLLLDGTWRLARKMVETISLPSSTLFRSIPKEFCTAYPRRQEEFIDPTRGLATVEALYIAYLILDYDLTGILDHYHWAPLFLEKNQEPFVYYRQKK